MSSAADQKRFAEVFARETGLNAVVVLAWMFHEQPVGSSAKGGNDWLNVEAGPRGGSGPDSPEAEYVEKLGPEAAAIYTAKWLATYQPSILASHTSSAEDQVKAIEDSNWAGSHYGYESPSGFLSAANSVNWAADVAKAAKQGAAALKALSGVAAVTGSVSHSLGQLTVPDKGEDPKSSGPRIRTTGRNLSLTGNVMSKHAARMKGIAHQGAPVRTGRLKPVKFTNPNTKRRTPSKLVKRPNLPKWKQVKI